MRFVWTRPDSKRPDSKRCAFEKVRLEAVRFEEARLEEARLEEVRLEEARLEAARFEAARLKRGYLGAPAICRGSRSVGAARGRTRRHALGDSKIGLDRTGVDLWPGVCQQLEPSGPLEGERLRSEVGSRPLDQP